MTQFTRCPYYESTSPKYPNMRCGHYHSGRERLAFESREHLHAWKNEKCFGDFTLYPYFKSNVGRDITYEDVWIIIVSVAGRDYWKRVSGRSINAAMNEALCSIINEISLFDLDEENDLEVDLKFSAKAVHSSHPAFFEKIEELEFSGTRLDDFIFW